MIRIKPGTTVIWINDADLQLEVHFVGKAVTLACGTPTHFVVDDKGAYVSNRIPWGATASLCFIQKGEFDYVVREAYGGISYGRTVPGTVPEEYKGKIIVE